jgi:hypothetical protein
MKFERNLQTGETTVIELTTEEVAERTVYERDVLPNVLMDQVRRQRDQLLAKTDYLGLSDLGGFSAEMTAYRQALRDLPANTTDPANPVWPTKPEVTQP